MNKKIKWQNIYYPLGALKYEGFAYFDLKLKELIPTGQGIKYFENGNKHMEGSFGNDWFIETGTEFYRNGNIKFLGEYNKGPRAYYGPRYFVFGRLFKESNILWYEGTFLIRHSLIGYPMFKEEGSFKNGVEFKDDGTVKKEYRVI